MDVGIHKYKCNKKKYPQDGGRNPESGAGLDPAHNLHDAWRGGRAQGAG